MKMQQKKESAGRNAWDLRDEAWPYDREDHEVEDRFEEWQDK
jgi:hypothetical protein